MPSAVIVGLQWGDEGKGKLVDLLSENADSIIRCQGGDNAGHTVVVGETEYRFHLIPSGIIYPQTTCYIGGGVVIHPGRLLEEMKSLEAQGICIKGRLKISPSSHVILPYHLLIDRLQEKKKGSLAIGTTGRGIGPVYTDAVSRTGIRMGELIQPDLFAQKLAHQLPYVNELLVKVFDAEPLSTEAILAEYLPFARELASYVAPVESLLHQELAANKNILFEGANGTYLDLLYGTYPFVTSSRTIASGILSGAGVGPKAAGHVLGIVKAYTTRVGNGPLPTALSAAEESLFPSHTESREIGTTTRRIRRMGWFDSVLVRHAVQLNGVDSLAITKLDILDSLETIKLCTHYRVKGDLVSTPPALTEDFEKAIPVYEELPGWKSSTKNIKTVTELPKEARRYIDRLEELCQARASYLSFGPRRNQTLSLSPIFQPRSSSL